MGFRIQAVLAGIRDAAPSPESLFLEQEETFALNAQERVYGVACVSTQAPEQESSLERRR